ncbi:replication initiation factor domain-containing protein [Streptococcus pluranimalium]|uniref:replication initiation factor domain-containing protein n=1 Tax=Streptococcus pluranimalium TaxID=82348 RepID=UPI003F6683EE
MFCKNEIKEYLQKNNNRKPVIMTSIDEVTFVIKPTEETVGEYPDNWSQIAISIGETVSEKLSLPLLFGDYIPLQTPPAGYTDGFTFQNLPYYFAIAWHETNFTMGVIIKFSATSLSHYKASYQEYYNKAIDVHQIAQFLNEDYWELRVSRIDLAVDYFNYSMSVNDLYQGLKGKQYIISNHKGRKNISTISAQEVNGLAQTMYVGSKKKNVNALLRIYNKYQEQLDNQGRYMHLTKCCDSWVRMEASYKGTYSNQILALLLDIENPQDLSKLIVNKMIDKYCFHDAETGQALPFTSDLLKGFGDFPELESLNSRNNDLLSTISYLMKGSGLFPLLKK